MIIDMDSHLREHYFRRAVASQKIYRLRMESRGGAAASRRNFVTAASATFPTLGKLSFDFLAAANAQP